MNKVGYNIQLAVDMKYKLIAEQSVCNQVLDLGLLAQTAAAAMEALGVERMPTRTARRVAVRAAVTTNWPRRSPPFRVSAIVTRRCLPNWTARAPTRSR